MFQANAPWYRDISSAALDSESSSVMAGLAARGGWGGGSLRVDFSIEVLRADASTPLRSFTPNDEFYSPDCDNVPVPVPATGRLEAESGYTCTNDGDCHLIVVQGDKLYEMWRANISGGTFTGGCMAVWDLKRDYWTSSTPAGYGRGNQCTSADAGGFPLTDLLFTADDVKAGAINHAIRFILPNDRIRKGQMVLPATHSGVGPGTPTTDTVPYGARLRLKKDFDLSKLKPGAQVVARAMQKYGMFLSDGGNIALTAQADTDTAAKWDGLLDASDLSSLKVTDFEMVDGGARVPVTNDCVRTN
jgi:serine/threonine-protein kinase